ncbi:Peroxiredoxin [Halorientalis persicus]|jgi:peroxiredoxin|uniref:Peroxiredoxin n=1 Tax=Halorientalis persicus TaxID=1367881 RepID=A0A1H8LT15_9EURY|nr:redoxin domain-containing protein [Halorientalis persicus]SEO08282.1 Peroxiredoxin [Halorientalis persicus]
MPPTDGDELPDFEALCCDGETFRSTHLSGAVGDRGAVLVSTGFVYSAIAQNWWKRFQKYGWDDFEDVPVLGISRDGPYAQNDFLRWLGRPPFRMFADVNGEVSETLDLLTDRDHMANVATPWRSVFVVDPDLEVQFAYVADEWIGPLPHEDVEAAVAEL